MGFKEWIIPQDRFFYELLERQIGFADKANRQLKAMVESWKDLETERVKLRQIEHEADGVAHELFERLNRTFITPFDRDDLIALARTIDDITDFLYASGNRIVLYELKAPTPAITTFIGFIQGQLDQLVPAITELRHARGRKAIVERTKEIHRLENEADRLLNRTVAELFKTATAVDIIKLKEIYDSLETATDRCEDVADVLNDILRKHG